MTENKRYTTDNGSNEDVCLVDNVTGKEFESDFDEIVDLLNEQEARINELEEENAELRQDNDIKFWKLQCMRQVNSTQLIVHEVSLAIKQGYEVSEQFQKYLDELKEHSKEIKEKNKRLFGDSG